MELRVVGASAGAPTNGACACYAVSGSSGVVLLDCGPGAIQHVWQSDLIATLDAIVITHMHADHMLDLVTLSGDLAQQALRERRGDRSLGLCLPHGRGVERLALLAGALAFDADRFLSRFALVEFDETTTIEYEDLTLRFARTAHPEKCFAVRVEAGGATLVYGADGAYTDGLAAFAVGADLLLLEATYVAPGPHLQAEGHMTGEEAAEVALQVGDPRLLLTHVAGDVDARDENLRRAQARFSGRVELARPGTAYAI